MKYILILVILFIFTLSGCNTVQKNSIYSGSCDLLLFKSLQTNLNLKLTSEQVVALVVSEYNVRSEDVKIVRYESENSWSDHIEWEDQNLQFTAVIKKGYLRVINISDENGKITANRLIECIHHQPEWYRAIYGPRRERSGVDYYFELWFPSIGVKSQSRGVASRPEELPIATSEFVVEHIDITGPGSVAEMLTNSYTAYLPQESPHELQIWPGAWEDIKFVQGW